MKGYYLMPHPPIIVSEVGKGREKEINKTIESCKKISEKIEESGAKTIIIITPHGPIFRDGIAMFYTDKLNGNLSKFGAPQVKLSYKIDKSLSESIIKNAVDKGITIVPLDEEMARKYKVSLELDHGAMVPLYFVGNEDKYELVHITYGMLSPIELLKFGTAIKKAVEDIKTEAVFIASGDLSHRLKEEGSYSYSPFGKKFDNSLINILTSGNLEELFNMNNHLIREAGECGLRSLYILAGAINSTKVKGDLLSYEGPFGVGYAVIDFHTNSNDELFKKIHNIKEEEHKKRMKIDNPYTKLARKNLDNYFNKGEIIDLKTIENEELINDKKGVFVSLKINGELRGCIGTIEPTTSSIAEEIIKNSLSAALNDPRFLPLRKEELLEVDISVDLLYPAEKTTFEELNPKVYGIIVTSGRKRGLLLPNLEGVDNIKQQISIALEKGNISSNENYSIERFMVKRFSEVDNNE
ncbi:AmmeMemoRadiSam system protein A [Clostridium tarantellae]|uniref:AmmeMemoRadiSam system protein A n=1 Tax=Clostridium tarantellae TaxID=39493 RepID=A0A6I1MPZ1_9CLOT|nr:AmmeMemoRadiSam system protein A [Clostridium tarantellae]MPQ44883.1 AmmeMemoRadiSam system protein A [Clostridium tarantellae]